MNDAQRFQLSMRMIEMIERISLARGPAAPEPEPTAAPKPKKPTGPLGEESDVLDPEDEKAVVDALNDVIQTYEPEPLVAPSDFDDDDEEDA